MATRVHDGVEQQHGFVPAMVSPELEAATVSVGSGGAIEIEFVAGVRMWLGDWPYRHAEGLSVIGLAGPGDSSARSAERPSALLRGRSGNLLKVIWHAGQGACLFTKRLERGRFLWPSAADGVVTISSAQLGYSQVSTGVIRRKPGVRLCWLTGFACGSRRM
jgi:transposase